MQRSEDVKGSSTADGLRLVVLRCVSMRHKQAKGVDWVMADSEELFRPASQTAWTGEYGRMA